MSAEYGLIAKLYTQSKMLFFGHVMMADGLEKEMMLACVEVTIPDSKNVGQWTGPIWQAQLGESLVMLIGPSWAPKFIALLGTKFGAH